MQGAHFYASGRVHVNTVNSEGTVVFQNCTAGYRGGALASQGEMKLFGEGSFSFYNCNSTGDNYGGGAISVTTADVVLELGAQGSVAFKQCNALSLKDGGSGGAIFSGRNINISAGKVEFDGCHAGNANGHALAAASGIAYISEGTRVSLPGMDSLTDSIVYALNVIMPVDSGIRLSNVFAMGYRLATKPKSQGNDTCPAGSRFTMDESTGFPIPGECQMCEGGTVSLAPSTVELTDEVAAKVGMPLVLVKRTSPNRLYNFPVLNKKYSANELGSSCVDPQYCPSVVNGDWDNTYWGTKRLFLGHSPGLRFTHAAGVLRRGEKMSTTCRCCQGLNLSLFLRRRSYSFCVARSHVFAVCL